MVWEQRWVGTSLVYAMVGQEWSNHSSIVHCPPDLTAAMHSAWVFKYFGECVMNVRQWFAFVIGMLSIACWLFAQVPQLVTNCRTGKADEALSFWFLMQWLLGDVTNLIGAVLTRQLATQIATAVYFVLIDIVTMSQYLYYLIKNQGCQGLLLAFICQSSSKKRHKGVVLSLLLPVLVSSVFLLSGTPRFSTDHSHAPTRSGRTLLMHWDDSIINLEDKMYLAGYIIGVFSAGLYVCSRVPQIVKNFMRCSVEGLSLYMFILAILGNVTYGLGILLYSVDSIFLLQKLPWLVGSVGTLCFDMTIIVQFIMSKVCSCRDKKGCGLCDERYSDQEDEDKPLLEREESKVKGQDLEPENKRSKDSNHSTPSHNKDTTS